MKQVKITITSLSGLPQQQDKVQVIAYGRLAYRAGKHYVLYEETAVTGMAGTKTTLKWKDQSLWIVRSGTYEHRQEYTPGYTCESVYKTPYLTVPLTAHTTQVQLREEPTGDWHLHVEYEQEVGGASNGSVILDIKIEEDITVGHQSSIGQCH